MHNRITHLNNNEGDHLEYYRDIKTELVSFYENLLTEDDEDRDAAQQQVISHIPSLVTTEQNIMLMRPTTLQEVETTIKQMKEDQMASLSIFSIPTKIWSNMRSRKL